MPRMSAACDSILRASILVTLLFQAALLRQKALASPNAQPTGRIAVFQNSDPITRTLPLSGVVERRRLESTFVHFESMPGDVESNASGCFCFELNDARFQYVHVLWHATQQIEELNRLFGAIGRDPLPQLRIRLEQSNETLGSEGSADLDGISLTAGAEPIDPGLIAHEIGHWAHYRLIGAGRVGFLPGIPFSLRADAERSGVAEGIANLIAAMQIGDPHVQKVSLPELPYDVNTFIQMPSRFVPRIFGLRTLYRSPRVRHDAPKFHRTLDETLSKYATDEQLRNYLDQPDEYLSSAAFNQPVWNAALEFGKRETMLVYLNAASRTRLVSASGYADFARHLIQTARERNAGGGAMEKLFKREFVVRGVAREE